MSFRAIQKKERKRKERNLTKEREATWKFLQSLFAGTGFSVSDRRINRWSGLHCHHWLLGGVLLLHLFKASTQKKESERAKARQIERERRERGINITQKLQRGKGRKTGKIYLKRRQERGRDKD